MAPLLVFSLILSHSLYSITYALKPSLLCVSLLLQSSLEYATSLHMRPKRSVGSLRHQVTIVKVACRQNVQEANSKSVKGEAQNCPGVTVGVENAFNIPRWPCLLIYIGWLTGNWRRMCQKRDCLKMFVFRLSPFLPPWFVKRTCSTV